MHKYYLQEAMAEDIMVDIMEVVTIITEDLILAHAFLTDHEGRVIFKNLRNDNLKVYL